jgi:hypothetical protein
MLNPRVGYAVTFGILASVASLTVGHAQNATPTTPAATAADPVHRFLARTDEPLTRYRARRTLRARNERFNKEGWITAYTELDPTAGFTYRVIEEGGSGYIRNKVLRKALDGEREAIAAGDTSRSALSALNYQFSVTGLDGPNARVRVTPLRKERFLVDGTITLVADSGDLLQVEGRLARNPSFWTNRVDVVRRYGRIEGVRVTVSVESTANVKIAGTSAFSMTYEYESINGKPVVGTASASAAAPHAH